MRRHALILPLLVAAALANGCASTRAAGVAASPAPVSAPESGAFARVIAMPPLLLEATPDGWQSWDAEQLFTAGNDAYDAGDWRVAVGHYDRLLRNYQDDPLVPSALFNAGLALQHDERDEAAEPYFAALVDRAPDHHLAPNALWNLMELRERREDWGAVLRTVEALKRYPIEPGDVFEVDARGWIARAMLRPTDAHVEQLESLATEYGRRLREGEPLKRDTYARVFWAIGEVHMRRSAAVGVRASDPQLDRQLESKSELLLRAQDAYMRTIRALDPFWATAAVFRIGQAYEGFYNDLVAAEAPGELDDRERQMYYEEVRKALEPVKRKAEIAYRRIIQFSKDNRFETQWVQRAEEHLAKLLQRKLPGAGETDG